MIESLLQEIGLSPYESKVYLALRIIKEGSSGQILEKAKIQSGRIYEILSSLIEKGLVSQVIRNNRKVFVINSKEALLNLIDSQQEELEKKRGEIIKFIATIEANAPANEEGYKYFEGIPAIKAMWAELIESLYHIDKDEAVRIHASKSGSFENLIGYFDEFTKARVKLKIPYKLILPLEAKWHGEKRKKQLSEVKYMPLHNEVQWGIIGDYYVQFYTTGKIPKGFLIKDKKFSETYQEVFDNLWKLAKK